MTGKSYTNHQLINSIISPQVLHARGLTSMRAGLAEADEERQRDGSARSPHAQEQSGAPAPLARMSAGRARASATTLA